MARSERERSRKEADCLRENIEDRVIDDEVEVEEVVDIEDDCECDEDELFQGKRQKEYKTTNINDLKNDVVRRIVTKKFTSKNFLFNLLTDDNFVNAREGMSYDSFTVSSLKKICNDRSLPTGTTKSSIIYFLQLNDKVQSLRSGCSDLKIIIA